MWMSSSKIEPPMKGSQASLPGLPRPLTKPRTPMLSLRAKTMTLPIMKKLCPGSVSMTNREKHDPNEVSNEAIYRFFEYWLKP